MRGICGAILVLLGGLLLAEVILTPPAAAEPAAPHDGHTSLARASATDPQARRADMPDKLVEQLRPAGQSISYDRDNPVRPAHLHTDKNFALRGYVANNDSWLRHELVNYGTDDPVRPPQFATLFSPNRVPSLVGFYRVHDWNWEPSPATRQPRRAADTMAGDGAGATA